MAESTELDKTIEQLDAVKALAGLPKGSLVIRRSRVQGEPVESFALLVALVDGDVVLEFGNGKRGLQGATTVRPFTFEGKVVCPTTDPSPGKDSSDSAS